MPPVLQWTVRTAVLQLVLAFIVGAIYQADQWLHWWNLSPYWIVVHVHLALVGGVIQMIMGVGLWMFPLTVPLEARLQFRPVLAWTTYGLLNAGLLGRFIFEYAYRATGADVFGALTLLTAVMQLASLGTFAWHVWSLRVSRRAAAAGSEMKH